MSTMTTKSENNTTKDSKVTKIWNRVFIAVFVANLAMNAGQQLVNPLISRYVNVLGGTPAIIGMVSSSFAIVALICKLFAGPIIDAFNKKWVLWCALVVMAVAFFGYSLSSGVSQMFAFRMIQGLGQAFTSTIFMVIVSQVVPADRLGTGMGVFWTAQSICMAMGSAVGIQLANSFGYNVAFAFGASLIVVAIVIVTFIHVKHEPTRKFSIKLDKIIAKEALVPASIMFLTYLAFCAINAFLIVYAEGRGIKGNVGLYMTVYAVTLFVSRPLVGKLKDKFGFVRVVSANVIVCIVVFFIFSVATNLGTLLIAGVIMGFGFGACQPAINALALQSVPEDKRGAASSTNYIGMDLGSLFGASFAGIVAEHFGYVAMWRIMTIPFFCALVVIFLFRKRITASEACYAKDGE